VTALEQLNALLAGEAARRGEPLPPQRFVVLMEQVTLWRLLGEPGGEDIRTTGDDDVYEYRGVALARHPVSPSGAMWLTEVVARR
jgi:hypothetical protein